MFLLLNDHQLQYKIYVDIVNIEKLLQKHISNVRDTLKFCEQFS